MKIIINNIAASSGGALSILRSFYQYLIKTKVSKEHEWIFLLSDNYIEEKDNIKVIVLDKVKNKWINRLKFDLYLGKKYISELKPDIVFSMHNTITFGLKCPQVLYMHQAIPFQKNKKFSFFKAEERNLAIYQYIIGQLIKLSIKKADFTIVQTKWVRDAVVECTNILSKKITNILPPLEDYTNFSRNKSFDNHSFFYPAAKNTYKNHKCIYDACTILNKKGITDYDVTLTVKNGIDKHNIHNAGDMPFESVLEKYNSSVLIFPSYIETIGLPLIEARQMETIILASDCPFSKEALDNYINAYYFDPFQPKELADLMEKVLSGEIIRKSIKKEKPNTTKGWESVIDILVSTAKKAYQQIP